MSATRFIVLAGVAAGILACNGQPTGPDLSGTWGGEHLQLIVFATGATLEYDCAHGTIDDPLRPDARGRFEARGVHVRGHGGPVREGEPPDEHPARYTGRIDGRLMTLTVTLTDTGDSVGSFRLTRGQPGAVVKCL